MPTLLRSETVYPIVRYELTVDLAGESFSAQKDEPRDTLSLARNLINSGHNPKIKAHLTYLYGADGSHDSKKDLDMNQLELLAQGKSLFEEKTFNYSVDSELDD